MQRAEWVQKTLQYALCILAFAIPFPFLFGSYTIILIFLLWLLQADYANTFKRLAERKVLWLWIIYFLLHCASYFYSENKGQSLFDLQSKISLLILPIVVGAGISINKKLLERIILFFTWGITVVAVFCIAKACYKCYIEGYIYVPFFFYHDLVDGLDASAVYMALYTLFSIACLLLMPWQYYYAGKNKPLKIAFIVLQVLFFILLSSRLLILLFFILLVPIYLRKIFKNQKFGLGRILVIAVLFTVVGVGVFATDNPVKKRYNDIFQKDLGIAWKKDYTNVPQDSFNNVTLRLMLWRLGYENMQENKLWLLGAGNGDAVDLQNDKMRAYGFDMDNPNEKKRSEFYNINLHNMFFQSLMMIGIPGVLIFSLMVFLPLFKLVSMKYKHIFIIFHVTALFFMFQEAIFQTQAGIVYYSLFSMQFWNANYSDDNQ